MPGPTCGRFLPSDRTGDIVGLYTHLKGCAVFEDGSQIEQRPPASPDAIWIWGIFGLGGWVRLVKTDRTADILRAAAYSKAGMWSAISWSPGLAVRALSPFIGKHLCVVPRPKSSGAWLDFAPTLKMISKEAPARAAHFQLSSLLHILRSVFHAGCKCRLDCNLAVEDAVVVGDR
jgi:hypothetical protein